MNVNSPPYVVLFAAVVSGIFTAAIMALHAGTQATVRRNEMVFRQKALVDVFHLAGGRTLGDEEVIQTYRRHIREGETVVDPQTGTKFPLLRAVRQDPNTGREEAVGYALPIWGTGFWARIDGYLALTPDLGRVVGITFLSHSETPGLGGRITEPSWRAEFRGLRVTPPQAGNRYVYVGGDKPTGPGSAAHERHVDALTGATGTSTAVDQFLNQRIAEFRRAAAAAGMIRP